METGKMMVSEKFKIAVKTNLQPQYKIARAAGLHYSTLSRIVHGIENIKPNDDRILAVARVLNLTPDECFEKR
jgi:transcriptional regulator with XRE-family HTH domain